MRRMVWSILTLATAVGLMGAVQQKAAPPTGEALEKLTSEVASQLRCPVCRSLSVEDSQAELSKKVRQVIHERLAEGQSPEQVKAYFVSKYGTWILLSPPKRGITLLVWVLPALALLGGAVVLAFLLRGWLTASAERGGSDEQDFMSTSGPLHPDEAIFDPEEAELLEHRAP